MLTKTTYTSDVKAIGKDGSEIGMMDVNMVFSAAYGLHTITEQKTAPMLAVKNSHGISRWMDITADISSLVQ